MNIQQIQSKWWPNRFSFYPIWTENTTGRQLRVVTTGALLALASWLIFCALPVYLLDLEPSLQPRLHMLPFVVFAIFAVAATLPQNWFDIEPLIRKALYYCALAILFLLCCALGLAILKHQPWIQLSPNVTLLAAMAMAWGGTWQLHQPLQSGIDHLFYPLQFDLKVLLESTQNQLQAATTSIQLAEQMAIIWQEHLSPEHVSIYWEDSRQRSCLYTSLPQSQDHPIALHLVGLRQQIQLQDQQVLWIELGPRKEKQIYLYEHQHFFAQSSRLLARWLRRFKWQEYLNQLETEHIQLQHKHTFLKDLTVHLSHDLKSPLGACFHLVQELQTNSTDLTVDFLRARLRQLQHILTKLQSYIVMSLDRQILEQGHLSLDCSPVKLQDILNDICVILDEHIKKAGLHFELKAPDEPLWIQGDAMRLERVFTNLLSNAIRHAHQCVTLCITPESAQVRMTLRDDGPGIHPTIWPHVFERYGPDLSGQHTPNQRLGNGLGLWISQKYVHLMGGTLVLASPSEEGCCFEISFPLAYSQIT